MSSIGLDPTEAADFADHVARTPGTPLDDPWFTGSTIVSPLMGLATGAANLSFLAEEAATPVLRPFAETLDKQFGTSGVAWLDNEQRLAREQIVRQQKISPRVFGQAGDMVRGLVQFGTEAAAGATWGAAAGALAGAPGGPWISAAGAIVGAPAGAVAITGLAEALPHYHKLLSEGVDPETAKILAGVEGIVAGGTALIPLHAKTWKSSLLRGGALMSEMNAFQRGATHEILDNAGYHDMAEQYKFLDAKAIATDFVMGALFGGLGRAIHGAPPGERNPTLADAPLVDSVARDREARGPGIPADGYTRDANQAAIEKGIDDLLQGKPVDVSKEIDAERAHFVADPHDEEFRVQVKDVAHEIVGPLPADQGGEPPPPKGPPPAARFPVVPVDEGHPAIAALAQHRDNMNAFTDASNTVPIDQLVSTKDESNDPRVQAGTKRDPRLTAAIFMVKSLAGETAARVPLKVERRPDGKLQVIDGNATVQAARLAGWTKIPVAIEGEAPAGAKAPGLTPPADDVHIAKLAPEQQTVLRKMYDKAAELKPAFDKSMEDIAAEVGGRAKTTDLKGTERAVEKIISPDDYNGDASKIKDLLRATVEVPYISDVPNAIAALYARYKDAPGTRPRNGLDPAVETTEDGYRDFKMNAIIDGHVTEVQINVPQMLEAKDRLHKYYKERAKLVRDNPELTPEQWEKFNELSRLMREGYEAAWRDVLDTSARNSASVQGEPLRTVESQEKGRGAASSYAVAEGALPSLSPEGATAGVTTTGTPSTLKNLEPAGKDLGSVTTSTSIAETMPGAVHGKSAEVKIGDTYAPAHWAIVPAAELEATVASAENQARDRGRAAAAVQVGEIANKLDYKLLGESPIMDFGAPTLAADGRVVGGNGRLLGIKQAYKQGNGEAAYAEPLRGDLARYGLDNDAARGVKEPVLVRILEPGVDVRRAALASNEGGAMKMSALEQAKVDGERLPDTRLLASSESGNLNVPANRELIQQWVREYPAGERNALLDADGALSAEGQTRLRNAVLFKAYGDSPTLTRLVESADPEIKNVGNALTRVAPLVAGARARIEAGAMHPLDLGKDLTSAVERYAQAKAEGRDVAEHASQRDVFGGELTPEAKTILTYIDKNARSARKLADMISGYYEKLRAAGNPQQVDMLSGAEKPTKAGLLASTIGDQGKQTALEREAQASLLDNPAMQIPTATGELVPAHDAIAAADQQIAEAAKAPDMLDAAINCDRKAA